MANLNWRSGELILNSVSGTLTGASRLVGNMLSFGSLTVFLFSRRRLGFLRSPYSSDVIKLRKIFHGGARTWLPCGCRHVVVGLVVVVVVAVVVVVVAVGSWLGWQSRGWLRL